MIVCILPTLDFTGKILVSTMDTLLQQCSLQLYNLSNLSPVHEKTAMNICCHPLRVETWMLQLLTGEHTQTVLVKSNIGDKCKFHHIIWTIQNLFMISIWDQCGQCDRHIGVGQWLENLWHSLSKNWVKLCHIYKYMCMRGLSRSCVEWRSQVQLRQCIVICSF